MTKRTVVSIGIVGLVVILIGAAVALWSLSGNQGSIQNASPTTVQKPSSPKQYNGRYLSFTYKGVYYPADLPAGDGDLQITRFTADTTYAKQLIATVSDYGGNLNNNSAYKLRSVQTDTYSQQTVTVQSASATQFVRNDGTEITVFIPHGNKLATLVFTSSGAQEDLHNEVSALLASLVWK